jgi:hypothetical protein
MNDVCWHEVVENGTAKLCSCPGYEAAHKAALEGREASAQGA